MKHKGTQRPTHTDWHRSQAHTGASVSTAPRRCCTDCCVLPHSTRRRIVWYWHQAENLSLDTQTWHCQTASSWKECHAYRSYALPQTADEVLHAVPKLRQWELLRLGGRRPQVAVRVDGCVWAVEEGRHVGVLLRLAEEVRVARGVLDINNGKGSHHELVVAVFGGHHDDLALVVPLEEPGVDADNLGRREDTRPSRSTARKGAGNSARLRSSTRPTASHTYRYRLKPQSVDHSDKHSF